MPPEHTLEHKEQNNPCEHIDAASYCPLTLHNLGENVDKDVAQERPSRKAHEVEEGAFEALRVNAKGEDANERDKADDDDAAERIYPDFGHSVLARPHTQTKACWWRPRLASP